MQSLFMIIDIVEASCSVLELSRYVTSALVSRLRREVGGEEADFPVRGFVKFNNPLEQA